MSWWSVATTTSSAPEARAFSATHATSGFPAIGESIFPGRRVERMRAGMMTLNARRCMEASGFLVRGEAARLFLQHHGNVVLHREGEPVGLADELETVLAPDERALAQR